MPRAFTASSAHVAPGALRRGRQAVACRYSSSIYRPGAAHAEGGDARSVRRAAAFHSARDQAGASGDRAGVPPLLRACPGLGAADDDRTPHRLAARGAAALRAHRRCADRHLDVRRGLQLDAQHPPRSARPGDLRRMARACTRGDRRRPRREARARVGTPVLRAVSRRGAEFHPSHRAAMADGGVSPLVGAAAAGRRHSPGVRVVIENRRTGEQIEFEVRTPELLVMRSTWMRPGQRAIAHVHPEMEERFEILAGRAAFRIDGTERIADAGQVVIVPPGTLHLAWNPTTDVVRLRISMRPALRWAEFTERLFAGEHVPALLAEFRREIVVPAAATRS